MRPIERLHAEVDAEVEPIERRLGERLRCARGCSGCCVDGIRVFEVEAERIRRYHGDLIEHGRPHEPGACAFLDGDGGCRIYADRPYVCRTQGLPLRWTAERAGALVECRDICPLNDPGEPPLESLPPEDCWAIGPFEARLAALARDGADPGRRVALRELFRRPATPNASLARRPPG